MQKICEIDLNKLDETRYSKKHVGVIILSTNNEIILQYRPKNWRTFPDCLATFGGHIEKGETPTAAAVRELFEELGAKVNADDLISLGAITEAITSHKELVYLYFWHDRENTITGCYEGEMRRYKSIDQALAHPKIMDDVCYALTICQYKNLL